MEALGNHYANAGQHREALAVYTEAAAVFGGQPTCRMQLGWAHRMAGEMHMLLDDFAAAGTHVEKFLRKGGQPVECAACACLCFRDCVNVFRFVPNVAGIAQQEENAVEEQRAYATIGRLHLLHGQCLSGANVAQTAAVLRRAETAFQRSLAVCKRLPDDAGVKRLERIDMQARLYLNLGVTRECLGDLDDTELNMERALQLCRDHNLYELLHQCYMTTASFVFHKRADTTKALRLLSLALIVAGERLDKRRKCETLIAKAEIFIRSADFQSARQTLHRAYRLRTPVDTDRKLVEQQLRTVVAITQAEDQLVTTSSTDHGTRRTLFERLGDGACQLRNFDKALDYYAMMLASAEKCFVSERELVPSYVSLYQTYMDLGRFEEALVYLRKEYDLVKEAPNEAISTLMTIADVLVSSGQDFWTIDEVLQQARGHAAKLADRKLETRIMLRMVRLRTEHNMMTLAEVLRDEAASAGIMLPAVGDNGDGDDGDDDNSSQEPTQKNTLEIGDGIDLDELSGSEADDADGNSVGNSKSTSNDQGNTATGGGMNDTAGNARRARSRRTAAQGVIKRNEKGETALHQACITGNMVQVRRLLDQSHPVNVRDFAGWMPLHEAANHGHVDVVRLLLERGASINDKGGKMCDGVTALHDACGNGCLEVVNVLLDAGANATMRTDLCETPVDTLEKWRRAQDSLDDVEQSLYTHVRGRLLQQMERTGVTRAAVPATPPRASSTQVRRATQRSSSDRRTQQVRTRRRQRRSSSVSSEDSDSDSGRQSTAIAPRTIDTILADEFATQQPTRPASDHDDDRDDDARPFNDEPGGHNASAGDACSDYRSVMAALRKSSAATTPLKRHGSVDEGRQAKRRAGILDDQEVGENWLDEDIVTAAPKKAKLLSLGSGGGGAPPSCSAPKTRFIPRDQRRSKENYQPIRLSGLSGSSSSVFNGFSGTSTATDDSSMDAFDVMMNPASNRVSSSTVRPRRPSSSTSKSAAGAGQRNSLLHAGFVQFKTAAHDADDADENVVSSTRMECETVALPAQRTAPIIPKIVAGTTFKVRVNEQLLNVPVNNDMIADLTIGWLAEETSRRYYK